MCELTSQSREPPQRPITVNLSFVAATNSSFPFFYPYHGDEVQLKLRLKSVLCILINLQLEELNRHHNWTYKSH